MSTRSRFSMTVWGVLLLAATSVPLLANEPDPGIKRALIVCGLSGDAAHHKQFAETTGRLRDGLIGQLGFAESDVQILFGDEPAETDAEWLRATPRSTREELEQHVKGLRERTRAEDSLWIIVLGHSHYDGRLVWLNLPGPDVQHMEFAKLFEGLVAREQVFLIATPVSGFFVKPLSTKGRVVMAATEADWETNETEYPHEFARLLSNLDKEENVDIDKDGRVTLFDLYVVTARNLAQSYLERELLATEHPLLDDDGDGRGTELQIDFLTVDQGGRLQPNRPAIPPVITKGDGLLAKSITVKSAAASQPAP